MSCLNLIVTPVAQLLMAANAVAPAGLSVDATVSPSLSVVHGSNANLVAQSKEGASLSFESEAQAVLTVDAVCGVSDGVLYALATQEGPLRLQGGGYLLLNPDANSLSP